MMKATHTPLQKDPESICKRMGFNTLPVCAVGQCPHHSSGQPNVCGALKEAASCKLMWLVQSHAQNECVCYTGGKN